jgi:hypothetical protein
LSVRRELSVGYSFSPVAVAVVQVTVEISVEDFSTDPISVTN